MGRMSANDPALDKYAQDCMGKFGYMRDGSWKSAALASYL